jgi:hypothetical protein
MKSAITNDIVGSANFNNMLGYNGQLKLERS